MNTLIVPLFFAVAIGVGAQSQPGKPETGQSGKPAQDPPKSTEGPELGAAAAKAMAAADKPPVNPLGELFDVTEEKRKLWETVDTTSLESINKFGKEDPCSKRIATFTLRAREAFLVYAKAYSRYIDKWSALTQEAIQNLEDQNADGKKPREDFSADLQRINAQIKQNQDDLAKMPDNATFADARDTTARVIDAWLKNKKTLEEAISDNLTDEEASAAQKQLLQAKLQEIDAMKQNRKLREEAAESKYQSWRSVWGMKCLVWTSKINKGQ